MRERKKSWAKKVELVRASFTRASGRPGFARLFYENLFFLNPKIKDYFTHTDFAHQEKALMHGLGFLMGYLDDGDVHAREQVLRIAQSHSVHGMKIHPHHYYYWIEALIMTGKELDSEWYKDLEFYWREVVSAPVSFIVSQYFQK